MISSGSSAVADNIIYIWCTVDFSFTVQHRYCYGSLATFAIAGILDPASLVHCQCKGIIQSSRA